MITVDTCGTDGPPDGHDRLSRGWVVTHRSRDNEGPIGLDQETEDLLGRALVDTESGARIERFRRCERRSIERQFVSVGVQRHIGRPLRRGLRDAGRLKDGSARRVDVDRLGVPLDEAADEFRLGGCRVRPVEGATLARVRRASTPQQEHRTSSI